MRRVGTQKVLTEDERDRLITELKYWRDRSSKFYDSRRLEHEAFNAIWKGQNVKGVKIDTREVEAWPFEGASDQRVRWGQTAFNDLLALVIVALDTCKIEVTCDGSPEGAKRAATIQKVISWCRAKLGKKWYEQIQAMLRYVLVDTPAVGAMDVSWSTRKTMGVGILSLDTLEERYAAWRVNLPDASRNGIAPEDAKVELRIGLEGDDEEAAELVLRYMTSVEGISIDDFEDIADALIADGECEARLVADVWEGPEIMALRYGDDFIIPAATEDFDMADPMIRHQWMSEPELLAMAANEDWDPGWVSDTLTHKGENFFDDRQYESVEDMKNLCDVAWFYTIETSPDGIMSRYVTVMSLAEGSAFGKRLLRARRGRLETVFFRRDVLANNCLASVGLAHHCAPDQGLAKHMKDMANNNAIVGSLPVVKAKGSRVQNAVLEPYALIKMGANDDLSFMQPPAYPAAAREQIKELKDELLAFLGLSNGETDVSTRTRAFTSWMMSQFSELYKRLVECAQDYASDEALMTVTGVGDIEGVKREDLDGGFQLTITFNPANLDHKDLIDRVTALGQVIAPLDSRNEIDRGPVVRQAFAQLFPECANQAFKSQDQMVGDDINDERQNFVMIKNGIMPSMDTEGKWNYAARLQFYQDLQQQNPNAMMEMSPRSQEMLQQWLAALEQQNRQFGENASIGRTGVQGVEAQ